MFNLLIISKSLLEEYLPKRTVFGRFWSTLHFFPSTSDATTRLNFSSFFASANALISFLSRTFSNLKIGKFLSIPPFSKTLSSISSSNKIGAWNLTLFKIKFFALWIYSFFVIKQLFPKEKFFRLSTQIFAIKKPHKVVNLLFPKGNQCSP